MSQSEQWREFPSDQRYEVSDLGNVRMKGGKNRKPSKTPSGYFVCVVAKNKKHYGYYFHRMVLEAFVGKCPDGMQVSHLNGINGDNRLSNLAYESPAKNMARKRIHGTHRVGESVWIAKLKNSEAKLIRAGKVGMVEACKKYKISRRTYFRAKSGETYQC